ncbi:hypothetical protein J6590_072954 [Homalodisca vitripennis]|nr:hypothetical protein J6590_072954 [Homalodisca vitripennis]
MLFCVAVFLVVAYFRIPEPPGLTEKEEGSKNRARLFPFHPCFLHTSITCLAVYIVCVTGPYLINDLRVPAIPIIPLSSGSEVRAPSTWADARVQWRIYGGGWGQSLTLADGLLVRAGCDVTSCQSPRSQRSARERGKVDTSSLSARVGSR